MNKFQALTLTLHDLLLLSFKSTNNSELCVGEANKKIWCWLVLIGMTFPSSCGGGESDHILQQAWFQGSSQGPICTNQLNDLITLETNTI